MPAATPPEKQAHSATYKYGHSRGFTLLELMAVITIGAITLAVAVPTYRAVVLRQKTAVAVRDLSSMAMEVERYRTLHFTPPPSLADIKLDQARDPWGNPYQYLNFSSKDPGTAGLVRKDHNLHPINSEFDLYSKGPDGDSKPPLTAQASRDDILWARDGGFVGVASDF